MSSTFNVFCLAGAERLVASTDAVRLREGPHLSKSLLKFERLVTDLSESVSASTRQAVQYESVLVSVVCICQFQACEQWKVSCVYTSYMHLMRC